MYFTKATISHFRSFQNEQTLELAIPNWEIGSGITYIVWENNSWKTTIIESLLSSKKANIRSSELQEHPPVFALYNDQELVRSITTIRENSVQLNESPILEQNFIPEWIPSRRHWKSQVSETSHSTIAMEILFNQYITKDPRTHNDDTHISAILAKIEADTTGRYEDFISLIQRVIPTFESYTLWYEEQQYIEYQTSNWIHHRTDFLWDGIISILKILAHLFINNDKLLVIDEPELSLHPSSQKNLLKIIAEYSQNRQIIISTHSPYFIYWEYIKNGAKLNRVTKHNDIKSEIFTLKDYGEYSSLLNASNWQQPFLMDVVSKEIFFNDNILFVEWQEDVWLLRQENDISDDINIFWYWVRWKDSFQFALKLAQDLWIQKAGCLLDKWDSEDEIKKQLEKEFPDYKVIQWNKEDIRDKWEMQPKPAKEWYFTDKGKKKTPDRLDDYEEKIRAINEYYES